MHKITPFLWFDSQAESAAQFYISLFDHSKMVSVSRYPDSAPNGGQAMSVAFELDGQPIMALNGGPLFKFTEAISFLVSCETQIEVDTLWGQLTADGGEEGRCGWLKDKFGLSWQIVPQALGELLGHPDPAAAKRVLDAMLQMNKIDSDVLRQAAENI